jgi:ribose-phosphate pyrophosphokinase
MPKPPSAIVSLGAGAAFADRVAEALGAPRIAVEERLFEDGEMKVRPLDVVRGRAVYLVQSLDGGPEAAVHDWLCRVLFLIGAMRDAGATEVRAVFPYLAYARKDRRTKPQDPLTLRYFAQLLEAVGIASVMALEVHDLPAFENAVRVPTVPLDTRRLFIDYLLSSLRGGELGTREPLVVSPDPGGIKRAQLFQEMLERRLNRPIGRAVADKRRSGGVVSGEQLYGEVRGRLPIIVDDLISSGGTIARTAQALVEAGAEPAIVAVAHGVFSPDAAEKLAAAPIARLLVTDSIDPPRVDTAALPTLEVVSAAGLVADAIACSSGGGSISALLEC